MKRLLFTLAFTLLALPLFAQQEARVSELPPPAHTASLAGPRFGLTMLGDGVIADLKKRGRYQTDVY